MRTRQERVEARERLRTDVQAGFDQLARGEGRSYDKTSGRQLAERIESKGRAVHRMRITLAPPSKRVQGEQEIIYTNNKQGGEGRGLLSQGAGTPAWLAPRAPR